MSKILIELNARQVSEAAETLPFREKVKLAEKLRKETIGQRWKNILKDIDSRLKKFPVSPKEVLQEIQAYRKQKHA